ncbi:cation transporter [Sulfitobacter mediterraneus]|uniref:cation diffusion facilitator family transporter n=1 Tax=Sulfitobacter mediterraneus TaxID=83219 RepID=UPI00193ACA12|nr:cation transporter [Sulfitobacter mediterraneus]MBM1569833.1 cation transporter [Sulfitobacter mediterraneus]MBM1573763.1 cation transporter [Sulfitobacter mediterraneus]MBM1577592.1 cation transporter [Sulfitobacter mediterraneus]MBM1581578.1 cation transporter [Sulfitobacter mediterraneus]
MSRKFALWSIPVALLVFLLKLLAWKMTGSVALLSDALESTVNVIAAGLAYYAVRLADKPADSRHPYGHTKAEYLSAVAEGVMILIAALLVIREAVAALPNPHIEDAPMLGIGVNVIAAIINGLWAYALLRVGRRNRSPALQASARHIFTDVLTSAGVVVGVILALATGWLILDPILAILVALNILREGWHVISESVDGLMDASINSDTRAEVKRIIEQEMDGALQFHDLRARSSGAVLFAEFHLVVGCDMAVGDAHDICDRIEKALETQFPGSSFTIHLEPDTELKK